MLPAQLQQHNPTLTDTLLLRPKKILERLSYLRKNLGNDVHSPNVLRKDLKKSQKNVLGTNLGKNEHSGNRLEKILRRP